MSTGDRKRPPLGEIDPVPAKKQMTQRPNPNLSITEQTQIAYHTSVPDQENILNVCVQKMKEDASDLQHYPNESIAANKEGFEMLKFMQEMRTRMAALEAENRQLQSHRQRHLDLRQRALATWVRDACKKDTQSRKDEIKRINCEVIHGGDIRSDAYVVTERYKSTSTERQSFTILYGLSAENILGIDQQKCPETLKALDRGASVLLKDNRKSFKSDTTSEERSKIVKLLLDENFEEAENKSSMFLADY